MTIAKLFARQTGNKEIHYRWLGLPEGGSLVHAQKFPGVAIVEDTWSDDDVDRRVTRRTIVEIELFHGQSLVMLDVEHTAQGPLYTAALLRDVGTKKFANWDLAKHIETTKEPVNPRDPKGEKRIVHTIEVDGTRRRFTIP